MRSNRQKVTLSLLALTSSFLLATHTLGQQATSLSGEDPLVLGEESLRITAQEGTTFPISGTNVNYPSQEQIARFYQDYSIAQGISNPESYTIPPVVTAPYQAGLLDSSAQYAALNTLNYIRYVAGLDYHVTLDANFTAAAQSATLVNAVNNKMTHYPDKPSDMDQDLYDLGYTGASKSNLASYWSSFSGSRTLSNMMTQQWLEDGDSGNIQLIGHRRWLLDPSMASTGFGLTSSTQNTTYGAMYALDTSLKDTTTKGVAWPAANTPVDLFGSVYPWSYTVGSEVSDPVSVTLTRLNDNKQWVFSSSDQDTSGKYFNIDNQNYGQPGCIIFRPNPNDISYSSGDVFHVSISGGATASYCVSFFDVNQVTPTYASLTPSATADSFHYLPASEEDFTPEEETPEDTTPEEETPEEPEGEGDSQEDMYAIRVDGVAFGSTTASLATEQTMTMTPMISPKNATNQQVQWVSSDLEVAEIDENGTITAIAPGLTTITVITQDGEFSATCLLTVAQAGLGYTVTFDPTGGTVSVNSALVTPGGTIPSLPTPVRENYEFIGWFTAETEGDYIGSGYVFHSNQTIYAQWRNLGTTRPGLYLPEVNSWQEDKFLDVSPYHWYYDSIQFAHQYGLMNGTSYNFFSPLTPTSRGMIVTILHSMAGKATVDPVQFHDVATTDYFASAVSWASRTGVTEGVGDAYFAPHKDITREQLVVMLYAFETKLLGEATIGVLEANFSDQDQISSWAVEATHWAASNGIIKGRDNGNFDPSATANRAEVATILSNFAQ